MATMNISDTLLQELSSLPATYYPKVINFIESLKARYQPTVTETMLLSESALAKDWDTKEEDEAWANL